MSARRYVMKFGGTSVGSPEAIRRTVELLRRWHAGGDQVIAVVSAMRGVTDRLIQAAAAAAQGDTEIPATAREHLWQRHAEAVEVLLGAGYHPVLDFIDRELESFSNLCAAITVLGEVTPRAMDLISSLGERFSAHLVAAVLQANGTPGEAIMADEIVVTDDTFGAANPQLDLTTERVRARVIPLLERGGVPVVTGFMGATPEGYVTTLGRGGSDYTAAILGYAVDADEVWIWTDVDGVMTADPRIVPDARTLRRISYTEAAEMAYFGAKVLHPKTVRPAVEKGIPIRIVNTFNPDHPGTLIVKDSVRDGRAVKAVTMIPRLALITVEGRGMLGVPGVAARVFEAVAHEGVSVLMISQSSSEQSICFLVEENAGERVVHALEQAFAKELEQGHIDRIWAEHNVVIIAAVGAGMRHTPGVAATIFGALGERRINVLSIAQGSSEYNLSLVVSDQDAHEAVRAIHAAFQLGDPAR
ncbi:MAG: aspartate kinase [Ardenticatenia bacterium]|nr:aspartate kinase [Ardenticatenia bacterium]